MLTALFELALFAAKALIIFLFILLVLIIFFLLLAKGKEKTKGKLTIKNLNIKYAEAEETLRIESLTKKEFKKFLKTRRNADKAKAKTPLKNLYVISFNGDIKASAVNGLCEEVTAILTVATPDDEVLVKVDSGGGVVHGYGLAAAQLMRFRDHHIPLTVAIDKIAASGGYLMACVANRILAAPFAIIGSIGVIVQLPNFHRYLKDKQIDFEQETAGEFKRTITLFGQNTKEGREKLREEIEHVHALFKNLIVEHRPRVEINKVATGEHWLAKEAIKLNLVDDIKTSDEYLLEKSKVVNAFEVCYEVKKPFLSKLSATASAILQKGMTHFLV